MLKTYTVYANFVKKYAPFRGFTGLTVRGAFGTALREIVCINPEAEKCFLCEHYQRCFYARVFEASSRIKPDARIAKRGGLSEITKLYTVSPLHLRGRNLSFKINVFGEEVISNEPIIVMAILGMAIHGLGRDPILNERRRFVVHRISASLPEANPYDIFTYSDGYIYVKQHTYQRNILEYFIKKAYRIAGDKPSSLILSFITPTRITYEGKTDFSMPMEAIIIHLARKYSLLSEYFNVGEPFTSEEAEALKKLVSVNISLRKSNFKVIKLHRYSIKQSRRQPLGLFVVGDYVYKAKRSFWKHPYSTLIVQLLLLGQYTHVGTFASAGCGEYKIYWHIK